MATSIYNESGTELQEERRYFLMPSSCAVQRNPFRFDVVL
jgi:hypothetical protein